MFNFNKNKAEGKVGLEQVEQAEKAKFAGNIERLKAKIDAFGGLEKLKEKLLGKKSDSFEKKSSKQFAASGVLLLSMISLVGFYLQQKGILSPENLEGMKESLIHNDGSVVDSLNRDAAIGFLLSALTGILGVEFSFYHSAQYEAEDRKEKIEKMS